jgi:hypothetical protein
MREAQRALVAYAETPPTSKIGICTADSLLRQRGRQPTISKRPLHQVQSKKPPLLDRAFRNLRYKVLLFVH